MSFSNLLKNRVHLGHDGFVLCKVFAEILGHVCHSWSGRADARRGVSLRSSKSRIKAVNRPDRENRAKAARWRKKDARRRRLGPPGDARCGNGTGATRSRRSRNHIKARRLVLFDGDGVGFANLDAGLTTETFRLRSLQRPCRPEARRLQRDKRQRIRRRRSTLVVIDSDRVAHFSLQKVFGMPASRDCFACLQTAFGTALRHISKYASGPERPGTNLLI